jgi:phage protein D
MAAAPQPLFRSDFYVPAYQLRIRDRDVQVQQDVISVSYTDSLTNIDSFDITVNNWDPGNTRGEPGKFKYSDGTLFDPWQDVELKMGYYHQGEEDMKLMMVGEITTMSPNFPASGGSTLTVRALNMFHRFRTKQETKVFLNKFESDIAKQLVEAIDKELHKKVPTLRIQMNDDEIKKNKQNTEKKPIPFVEMHNQYPIVFLVQRARDIGYELTMSEEKQGKQRIVTMHYRPTSDVTQRVYKLEWGKSLISFQPTLQTANQVSEVVVRGWDPQGKTKIEEKATRADLVGEGTVNPADLGVTEAPLSQKIEIVVDHPVQGKDEAKRLAKKTLKQLAQGLVEAKGQTIGLPDLRAGSKVEIAGLGTRFSGTYAVTGTTHTIGDGGYTTSFTARREQKETK